MRLRNHLRRLCARRWQVVDWVCLETIADRLRTRLDLFCARDIHADSLAPPQFRAGGWGRSVRERTNGLSDRH